MIKFLITAALIAGLYLFGRAILNEYRAKQKKDEAAAQGLNTGPADGLAGLPPQFEASLRTAQSQGAAALKAWLDRYRPYVRDPKLAAIELDYVVLVSRSNPAEARRVFQSVQRRVGSNSPVYERVKRLEPTYGQ